MRDINYKSADEENQNILQKIEGYADKLVGDEGVKFSVDANLHPSNYMYIGIAIAGGMIVGALITAVIKKATKTN